MTTRKQRLSKWLAGIAFVCLATPNAMADKFTFESPTYSTGNFIGQNSWATGYSSSGTADVVDNLTLGAPLAGDQSIKVTEGMGIMSTWNSFDAISLDGSSISWQQKVTADGTGDGSGIFVSGYATGIGEGTGDKNAGTGAQTPAWVRFNQGNIEAVTRIGLTGLWLDIGDYIVDTAYDVSMTFDFTNQQYAVNVTSGGTPVASRSELPFFDGQRITIINLSSLSVTTASGSTLFDNIATGEGPRDARFTFESPTYTTGNFIGQGSWATGYSSSGTAEVVDNLTLGAPLAGDQSIKVTEGVGIMSTWNSFDAISLDGVSISWQQKVTEDGTGNGSGIFVSGYATGTGGGTGDKNAGTGAQTPAWVRFNQGNIEAVTRTGLTGLWLDIGDYVVDTAYDISMTFDFTNQQYAVNVTSGGIPVASRSELPFFDGQRITIKSLSSLSVTTVSGSALFDNIAIEQEGSPIASGWWPVLENVWTPIGWRDHFLRGNVLFNGMVVVEPSMPPYIGQGVQLEFIPSSDGIPPVLFDNYYTLVRKYGTMGNQGWNEGAAPILWTEWVHDGLILRKEIFAHVAGGWEV